MPHVSLSFFFHSHHQKACHDAPSLCYFLLRFFFLLLLFPRQLVHLPRHHHHPLLGPLLYFYLWEQLTSLFDPLCLCLSLSGRGELQRVTGYLGFLFIPFHPMPFNCNEEKDLTFSFTCTELEMYLLSLSLLLPFTSCSLC